MLIRIKATNQVLDLIYLPKAYALVNSGQAELWPPPEEKAKPKSRKRKE
jgi:hypothetical protein